MLRDITLDRQVASAYALANPINREREFAWGKTVADDVVRRSRHTGRDSRPQDAAQNDVPPSGRRARPVVMRFDYFAIRAQSARAPGLVHFVLVDLRMAGGNGDAVGSFRFADGEIRGAKSGKDFARQLC